MNARTAQRLIAGLCWTSTAIIAAIWILDPRISLACVIVSTFNSTIASCLCRR